MKPGNSIAWGGEGRTLASQAFGGKQIDARPVAAGGMEYEEPDTVQRLGRYQCRALKKDGEPCHGWCVNETAFCQGHLNQLEKLNRKIEACTDEAERLVLEEERLRKWL